MGKWYNHKSLIQYKADLAVDRGSDIEKILPHIEGVARAFSQDSIAIGTLDLNDLIQAGNAGLVEAWDRVNWKQIEDSPNPQGELWSFLKIRIKGSIRREIDKYGEHISTPINQLENARRDKKYDGLDRILTNVFPEFFDTYFSYVDEDEYSNELSYDFVIDELYRSIKSDTHRLIIMKFYGIKDRYHSQKELAGEFNLSVIGVKKILSRSLKKMRNQNFKNLIENIVY